MNIKTGQTIILKEAASLGLGWTGSKGMIFPKNDIWFALTNQDQMNTVIFYSLKTKQFIKWHNVCMGISERFKFVDIK